MLILSFCLRNLCVHAVSCFATLRSDHGVSRGSTYMSCISTFCNVIGSQPGDEFYWSAPSSFNPTRAGRVNKEPFTAFTLSRAFLFGTSCLEFVWECLELANSFLSSSRLIGFSFNVNILSGKVSLISF